MSLEVKASENDILECQFTKWYSLFEKNTIRSKFVDLNDEFIEYLGQDGIIIPSSVPMGSIGKDELSDDEELKSVDAADFSTLPVETKNFVFLEETIVNIITEFNNEVFIKLNWSAPHDVSWIIGGSLKCRNLADIYLLLKSSDRITFDIENSFSSCDNCFRQRPDVFTLVIRKWANLISSMEFRIFIKNKRFVGNSNNIN